MDQDPLRRPELFGKSQNRKVMKELIILLIIILIPGCTKKLVLQNENVKSDKPEEVIKGEVSFMKNCNRCHPVGMAGLGPAIINKPLPGFMIKLQVRQGLGTMPAFDKKHLPKNELNNIVDYIKQK